MKRQGGFIELSAMAWGAIAAGVLILLLSIGLKVQTDRLRAVTAEYGQFKGGVEALGLAAEHEKAAKEKSDKEKKEKADAEHTQTIAALNADIKRLRVERARRSFVPGAATSAGRPGIACFDATELESAIRGLDQEVRGLVDQGSAAIVDLNTAKRWAQTP
jgi:hypothetical protein